MEDEDDVGKIIGPVQIGELFYLLDTCDLSAGGDRTARIVSQSFGDDHENYPRLSSVVIPSGVSYEDNEYRVVSIGYAAFAHCDRLRSVIMPDTLIEIDDEAFWGCRSLSSIVIPATVTHIGNMAFFDCDHLTSVELPDSLVQIGDRAFSDSPITSIHFPDSIQELGESVFYQHQLAIYNRYLYAAYPRDREGGYSIPDGIQKIASGAFYNSKVYLVVIPESVAEIGNEAFRGCKYLTAITCNALTPPILGQDVFLLANTHIPLYVPEESIALYQTSAWNVFTDIRPRREKHKLIYFHGFGSSAASGTIQTLREKLTDFTVIAPDIPVDPAEALPFLRDLCRREQPEIIVGTSMGGMYAQQMFGFKRICVNPALHMSKESKVLKEGTFEYFKPRLDGETHFTITKDILRHFAEMEDKQFVGMTEFDYENVWGLFGYEDKQVDCEIDFKLHYPHIEHFYGGHRLREDDIEYTLIPIIRHMTGRFRECDFEDCYDDSFLQEENKKIWRSLQNEFDDFFIVAEQEEEPYVDFLGNTTVKICVFNNLGKLIYLRQGKSLSASTYSDEKGEVHIYISDLKDDASRWDKISFDGSIERGLPENELNKNDASIDHEKSDGSWNVRMKAYNDDYLVNRDGMLFDKSRIRPISKTIAEFTTPIFHGLMDRLGHVLIPPVYNYLTIVGRKGNEYIKCR